MLDLRRRQFLTLLGGAAAAWPLAARAQRAGSAATIGLLWPGDRPPESPRMESFRQGLRALGFVDGQNIAIELRYAQGGPEHAFGHEPMGCRSRAGNGRSASSGSYTRP